MKNTEDDEDDNEENKDDEDDEDMDNLMEKGIMKEGLDELSDSY